MLKMRFVSFLIPLIMKQLLFKSGFFAICSIFYIKIRIFYDWILQKTQMRGF